jgi:predicted O-methyltransferase YrrM
VALPVTYFKPLQIKNHHFDFVFVDANKDWSKNYFTALAPKLEIGGCSAARNARNNGMKGIEEFIGYVMGLTNCKTTIDTSSRAGIPISYKMRGD